MSSIYDTSFKLDFDVILDLRKKEIVEIIKHVIQITSYSLNIFNKLDFAQY